METYNGCGPDYFFLKSSKQIAINKNTGFLNRQDFLPVCRNEVGVGMESGHAVRRYVAPETFVVLLNSEGMLRGGGANHI
ncbi:MAG: hypothetical protein LBS79_05025 [Tannerella sp.]|jgi:hypothetical protein|nr:hypothetical protein [Tannerella sp.]